MSNQPLDPRNPYQVPDPSPYHAWGPSPHPAGPDFEWRESSGTQAAIEQARKYIRLVYAHRWLVLACAILGVSIAAFKTFREPRLYTAQSTVEFNQAIPPGKDLDILSKQLYIPEELARRLLTTKILAARVINIQRARGDYWFGGGPRRENEPPPEPLPLSIIEALQTTVQDWLVHAARWARAMLGRPDPPREEIPPSLAKAREWEGVDVSAIGAYYSHIGISPVRMTSLVDIVVTHPDPVIAAAIANDHARVFVEMDAETKAASLSDAQGLMAKQLREVREQLEASRKALSEYQLEHGILSLPKDSITLTRQSVQQMNSQLIAAEGERIAAEAAYRYAESMPSEKLQGSFVDAGLQGIRDEIVHLQARYHALLQQYGANHPDMIAMQSQIESLRDRLSVTANQLRQRLRAAFEAAAAKERGLRKNLDELSREATQEERQLVQLLILQREVSSNEELYSSLIGQSKATDLSVTFNWTNVKQVDRAVVPSLPSYPQTRRNLRMGLLIGLGIGVLLALLIEQLDTTIHTAEELQSTVDLPVLAIIPDFERIGSSGGYGYGYGYGYGRAYGRKTEQAPPDPNTARELVTLISPASVVSEAYRTLRTNLMFSTPGHPPKTVLITSSQGGEGKTVTAVNLAISLALHGSKVLVVDADLRKPSCHEMFRVDREPGLSSVLSGQCDLDVAIVRSPLSPKLYHLENGHGLYVLPAGPIPPNPAELLGSAVMGKLLEEAKERFEFVVIDSPPVLPVTDSVVLSTKAEAVVFVVREGEWRREVVRKAVAQLRAVRARTRGAVLNRVNVSRGSHGYYSYKYHYGYGGYYGYPSDSRESDRREHPA
jgi:capsular exopolysaccharide synthesis family protein